MELPESVMGHQTMPTDNLFCGEQKDFFSRSWHLFAFSSLLSTCPVSAGVLGDFGFVSHGCLIHFLST
jgi:hypothetical protein